MALSQVQLQLDVNSPIPPLIESFLNDAAVRVNSFIDEHCDNPVIGFVPSDYTAAYRALQALRNAMPAVLPGECFCEWGSGLGVVAGLAAMLGFDAIAIELEPRLAQISQNIIDRHLLPVRIVQGSFIPDNLRLEDELDLGQADMTLLAQGKSAYDELGLDPDDFDCIYAYPWPGEDEIVATLFDRCAARGAVLMTYHGQDGFLLRRKK